MGSSACTNLTNNTDLARFTRLLSFNILARLVCEILTGFEITMEMRIGSGTSYLPPPHELTIESRNWVKGGNLRILHQNVGRSSLVCKFIFRFPYVEPFGHDDSPNEGTITFLARFWAFPSPPIIWGAAKNPMTGYKVAPYPSRSFASSEN